VTASSILFWVAAALCIVAEVAILRSALRAAAAPGVRRSSEIVWALLPAAGLILVLYLTWRAVEPAPPRSTDVAERGASIGA
jgi:hypothetical protein